ncbi:hypothetical protein AWB83_02651 [Caballeronia ptereochthonis]|uniref:Uncharacterized protein n=1 Tax=Caballeronia ptereochthonis TaxID=1777144 RepID=A0A158B1W6_9BURK|nr:hypothetical protein AWB83_02651 [Caballeronia ptereochthonis]
MRDSIGHEAGFAAQEPVGSKGAYREGRTHNVYRGREK